MSDSSSAPRWAEAKSAIRLEQALGFKCWLDAEGVTEHLGMSFVYVIRTSDGLYKIGRSDEPERRLAQLQTASPYRLELHCIFPSSRAAELEASLHRRSAEFRMHGEWFRLPDSWANALLLVAADMWEGVAEVYRERAESDD